MTGPMEGLRVVELGVYFAAPCGAAILADWGADVIKIEPPAGEPLRIIAKVLRPTLSHDPYFGPNNRSKRAVSLDLKDSGDLDKALRLIDTADVFITNVRPAGLARAGLDSDSLLARNPRLIYALITGYGLEGPDAAAGAYDMGAYWARSGIADLLSLPGEAPPIQRNGMGDHVAGMAAAGMVSAALYSREKTGRGQLVTTSLMRLAAYQLKTDLDNKLILGTVPPREDRRTAPMPTWNNYMAGDGKRFWLMGPEPERHWPTLLKIVGRPEWAEDERFATIQARADNAVELIAALDAVFLERPRDEWTAMFSAEKDFFWAAVNDVDDLMADAQFHASGAVTELDDHGTALKTVASPFDFHGTPCVPGKWSPELGEHNAEVLGQLDVDSASVGGSVDRG